MLPTNTEHPPLPPPPPHAFSKLGHELVVEVLQHVRQKQRLCVCALVCTEWRAAAVAATSSVAAEFESQAQCDSWSAWMQMHPGPVAALTSVQVACASQGLSALEHEDPPTLLAMQLLQRLPGLQQLHAERIHWSATANSLLGGLGSCLQRLTKLELFDEAVAMPCLALLTSLRHLTAAISFTGLDGRIPKLATVGCSSPGCWDSPRALLAEALPKLQQLTYVQLAIHACCDATVSATSSLQHLQALVLIGLPHDNSSRSIAALQQSLTALELHSYGSFDISPSVTPAICRLTALQSLDLNCHSTFDAAVLAELTGLTRLAVSAMQLAAERHPRLLVLSRLTRLQHLELQVAAHGAQPSVLTAAEAAALVASDQLTHLSLCTSITVAGHMRTGHMRTGHMRTMFAATGRQLLQLVELQIRTDDVLSDAAAAEQMVACCPNLQHLKLLDSEIDTTAVHASTAERSLARLLGLTRLAALQVSRQRLHLTPEALKSFGSIPALRTLQLSVTVEQSQDLLHLTTCRSLFRLEATYCLPGATRGNTRSIYCETAPGAPCADVWAQLGVALVRHLAECFQDCCYNSAGVIRMATEMVTATAAITAGLPAWQELCHCAELRSRAAETLEESLQSIVSHMGDLQELYMGQVRPDIVDSAQQMTQALQECLAALREQGPHPV